MLITWAALLCPPGGTRGASARGFRTSHQNTIQRTSLVHGHTRMGERLGALSSSCMRVPLVVGESAIPRVSSDVRESDICSCVEGKAGLSQSAAEEIILAKHDLGPRIARVIDEHHVKD